MSSGFDNLFSEGKIGDLNIRNRVVMPPMATNFGDEDGSITEKVKNYYAERAKGGTGLIISENFLVDSPDGKNVVREIRIDDDKYIPELTELAERVHNHGAKMFVQIHHAGRETTSGITEGIQPVSASSVKDEFLGTEPRRLETKEVEDLVDKFVDAAERVKRAGFDGVELHGAHGYLIGQFISSRTNKRDDKYGGRLEDRLTFAKEIIRGIRNRLGEDFPIGFRLSIDEFIEEGHGIEESKKVAKILEDEGIDVLHATAAIYESMNKLLEPMRFEEAWRTNLAEEMKEILDIPIIAVGVIRKPETAEEILDKGKADFVAMGRAHIADPHLVEKASRGRTDEINKCISCNIGCIEEGIFGDKAIGCTINPEVGREKEFNNLGEAENRKDVAVIGGGPAGMEAALYADKRGHDVTLYEEDGELGGQLSLCSKPPGKDKINWFKDYLEKEIENSSIRVKTGVKATPEKLKEKKHESIVMATGAKPLVPEISGIENENVVSSWEVLKEEVNMSEENAVILGGGQVGFETAEFLLEKDNKITVLEMLDNVATDMETITRFDMIQRLQEEKDIEWFTGEKVVEIDDNTVITENIDGSKFEYESDRIVLALGTEAVNDNLDKYKETFSEVYKVGDAREPRRIYQAVKEGAEVGISIGAKDKTYTPMI